MKDDSRVGVRELRQNLSVYLERVRRGETFTVTDRRRIVAVLGPAARTDDALARLIAEGRATAAQAPLARPTALRLTLAQPFSRLVAEASADRI